MVVRDLHFAEPAVCFACQQPLIDRRAAEYMRDAKRSLEKEVTRRVEAQAIKQAQEVAAGQLQELQGKLATAEANLAELRKQRKTVRSEVQAAERARLEKQFAARARSHEKTIELLRRQNEELNRRVVKLSAQERGEAAELDLVASFRRAFPDDKIEHRGKGGDVLQTVRRAVDGKLVVVGSILYERKDHLAWRAAFVSQVRADAEKVPTAYAVLVSHALPARQKGPLCVCDGVVVTQPAAAVVVAGLVRRTVIAVGQAARTAEDRDAKTTRLFEYLSSEEFRQGVQGLIDAATGAHKLLGDEQRSHAKTWERRREIYAEMDRRTSTIEGRIRAIVESSLPVPKGRSGHPR